MHHLFSKKSLSFCVQILDLGPIVTNGTLLNEEIIERLNQMELDTIWISFEGLKTNHENLRGTGTFEKALNALKLLRNFNGKVAIRMSLSKNNISEYNKRIYGCFKNS